MNKLEKMQEFNKEISDKLKELLPEETLTPQEEKEIKKISQELSYQKLNSLLKNKRR